MAIKGQGTDDDYILVMFQGVRHNTVCGEITYLSVHSKCFSSFLLNYFIFRLTDQEERRTFLLYLSHV